MALQQKIMQQKGTGGRPLRASIKKLKWFDMFIFYSLEISNMPFG